VDEYDGLACPLDLVLQLSSVGSRFFHAASRLQYVSHGSGHLRDDVSERRQRGGLRRFSRPYMAVVGERREFRVVGAIVVSEDAPSVWSDKMERVVSPQRIA
jgi:hypothetical protein